MVIINFDVIIGKLRVMEIIKNNCLIYFFKIFIYRKDFVGFLDFCIFNICMSWYILSEKRFEWLNEKI